MKTPSAPRPHTGPDPAADRLPLRVWPALLALALGLASHELPLRGEGTEVWRWMLAGFGPLLGSLVLLGWWVFASRATPRERWGGFLGLLLAIFVAASLAHPSVRGPVMLFVTLPLGITVFGVAAVVLARWRSPMRTQVAVLAGVLGLGLTPLLRNEGVRQGFDFALRWRWTPSAEDHLLAETTSLPDVPQDPTFDASSAPDWPGFRGPDRDGTVDGVALAETWSTSPPERLWSVRVGPGWSSFSVGDGRLFTQEQRGPDEATVCLDAETGERLWMREIEGRFEDPLGGPGPRATPTLAGGALFALGARGNLARLDPATGAVVWEVELTREAGREPPNWGFSGSPLVHRGLVIVHAGGDGAKGLLAFRADSGELAWSAPSGDHSYASPELLHLLGEDVVAIATNVGLDLVDPATGDVRLAYEWPHAGYRALQPAVVPEDGLLLPTAAPENTRRLRLSAGEDGWSAAEVWTSRNLKPDFNDLVVMGDHAFGFDGSRFACIDLATGEATWKGVRYGKGQVLGVVASGHLLVITDEGEAVLVAADPSAHRELGRFQALEGKCWSHPVLVGDRLFVRNAEQAAAWRLPLSTGAPGSGT